jgi:hypothetical protein
MNALQQQREAIAAVRERLNGPARTVGTLVVMKNPQNAPKPLAKFDRWLKRRPKWIEPKYVYLQPVGPLRPPSELRTVLCPVETSLVIAKRLVHEICAAHRVSRLDLISARRSNPLIVARQELMWRLRQETAWSLAQIGHFLGDRDHTTVLYGCRRHAQRMLEAGQ